MIFGLKQKNTNKISVHMEHSDSQEILPVIDVSGLEVIKLEFILKLKIKRKQPIIELYFELETVLKFYNLRAWLKRMTQTL